MAGAVLVSLGLLLEACLGVAIEIAASAGADVLRSDLTSGGVASVAPSQDKLMSLLRKEMHSKLETDALPSTAASPRGIMRHFDDAVATVDRIDSKAESADTTTAQKWHLPMSRFVGVTSWLQKVMAAVPMKHKSSSLIELHSNSSRLQPTLEGYRDASCAEPMGGYKLPNKVSLRDNGCVSVSSSSVDESKTMDVMGVRMNLKIICTDDDKTSKLGIIFGNDCSTGFEENMVLDFDAANTKVLGSGGCARGVNHANDLEEYMQFGAMDSIGDLPKCFTVFDKTIVVCIVGAVAFFLVCSGCSFYFLNREDPAEIKKRLREEKAREEKALANRLAKQETRRASRLSSTAKDVAP